MVNYLSAPIEIALEITSLCNLNCKHCFQPKFDKKRQLSTDEIKLLLDELKKLKVFIIFIGGGEPLIREDFFELAKYMIDDNFCVIMSTNGTLITRKVAKNFANIGLNYGVQVSLEGSNAKIHDKVRGEGSFKKAIKGIKNLQSVGISPSIGVTVTKYNLNDILSMVNLAIKNKLQGVHIMCLMPSGQGANFYKELNPSLEEWINLEKKLRKISPKIGDKLLLDWGNRCFQPPRVGFDKNTFTKIDKKFAGCFAGRTKAAIGCYGDVYGCDILKEPRFIAGNIRKQTFKKIWNDAKIFKLLRKRTINNIKGKCKYCKYKFACVGGCPAIAFYKSKDIFMGDPTCPHNPQKNKYLKTF